MMTVSNPWAALSWRMLGETDLPALTGGVRRGRDAACRVHGTTAGARARRRCHVTVGQHVAVGQGRSARLRACEQLRRLNLTVWYNLYAERLPDCRERAAELTQSWRAG